MNEPTDVEKLAAARVDRVGDCTAVAPVDLLRAATADILTGRLAAERIVICFSTRNPPGVDDEFGTMRCGVTRLEQIGLLQVCLDQAVRYWRGV
ncbi:MAG: hypothetical protein AB7F22_25510 [Reyranella sp.]|uniref:hypothetical protein n=1 Tax=Reyranella sp. TaxID=1929291 RepID=UPI003D151E55